MNFPGRTPEARARILTDRIKVMYTPGGPVPSKHEYDELYADIVSAFRVMEHDGEVRGRIMGSALAKLTPEERVVLGIS